MKRILENPAMSRRSNLSLAILIAVFVYGLWELWHATTGSGSTTDYLFGFLFLGGAAYGLRTTLAEARDLVIGFDADLDSGQALLTLWAPFRMRRIETTLDRITDWRLWVQTGSRGQRNYYLFAREPSHPGELRFEITPGQPIPDELRRIAPGAISDFETETGKKEE